MKHWFPKPLTSVLLFCSWLLFNQSVSAGHVLLAALMAFLLPLLLSSLLPLKDPSIHRPMALLRLLGMSLIEIVRSSVNVTRIILLGKSDGIHSQFIRVPLDMKDSYGLALLSCLINITPGTVWVEIMPESGELSLHVFDLHDEQWWIETIKSHYEEPLMLIFENRTLER